MFIAALFVIAKTSKQPRYPSEWMVKQTVVYPCHILLSNKTNKNQNKNQTIATSNNLDENPENYAEWRKSIPEDHILFDFIYIQS